MFIVDDYLIGMILAILLGIFVVAFCCRDIDLDRLEGERDGMDGF